VFLPQGLQLPAEILHLGFVIKLTRNYLFRLRKMGSASIFSSGSTPAHAIGTTMMYPLGVNSHDGGVLQTKDNVMIGLLI
jgi:hypothetical protein